ncbi:MAG: hypothetical protein E7L17_07480 [Clostridium sp.]|uniref:hypothetical protein n=1 Tax=Clostridium sp. TaxID=1506 RepID=UPI00291524B6|nr:hypothetical protein [Clostridium sp.]MDU7337937.1 hypothetical protein [Clostridium sp.]
MLSKYLICYYDEDQAKQLLLENKNNLFGYHGLAYALGKRSLEFFCMYFLQDIYTGEDKAALADIHYTMWDEVQEMILNKSHDKQAYILPRGLGKSTVITLAVAIWCAVYKFKTFTVIASAIGDTAEAFIRNIRMAIEGNAYIESAFGKLFDPRKCVCNSEKIELTNKTMIQSVSASSSLRGKAYNNKRIELALLDDYQKADEIVSDEQRERKWKRFSDDINYAMQKDNSTIIALGTLQCKGDFYDRLRNSPTWKTRQAKAVLLDNLEEYFSTGLWSEFKSLLLDKSNEFRLDDAKEFYFQNQSEMQFPLLWQDYWSYLDMALLYYENPVSFEQEMQGNIDNVGVRLFKTILTKPAHEIESQDFKKTILSIDPAGTARIGSKRDYYAFCILSEVDSGIKYARKSLIHDFEMDDYIDLTIRLLKEYPDIAALSIEKNVYSGADAIRIRELINKDDDLKHRQITIINKSRTKNKDNRISAIVGDVNMGRVIFNEEDTEAIQQLQDFCGTKFTLHDDYPDCLADAIEQIAQIETASKLTVLPFSFLGL